MVIDELGMDALPLNHSGVRTIRQIGKVLSNIIKLITISLNFPYISEWLRGTIRLNNSWFNFLSNMPNKLICITGAKTNSMITRGDNIHHIFMSLVRLILLVR